MLRQSLKAPRRRSRVMLTRTCRLRWFASSNSIIRPVSRQSNGRPFDEIPGPKAWPFIGNLFDYKSHGIENILLLNEKYFKKYGSIFKETLMGSTFVNICDPADIEKVFRAEAKYPSRGVDFDFWEVCCKKRGVASNMVFIDGEEWLKARKLLAPKLMRPKELYATYIDRFDEVAEDAIISLKKARGEGRTKGEVLTMAEELKYWALESIGTLVLNTRVGIYESPPRKAAHDFIKAVDDIMDSMMALCFSIDAALWRYVNTKSWKNFCKAFDVLFAVGSEYLKEGIQHLKTIEGKTNGADKNECNSLLAYLLLEEKMTPPEVTTTAITMIGAGVDSTSTTLLWLLYFLGLNEEAQERAHSEIMSVIGKDGKLKADDLGKIPYLKACLKESMRLVPPNSFHSRALEDDIELKGYHIPAGTRIQLSTMFVHLSEAYYDKPHQFRPERWLRVGGDEIHPFAHIPFGFGLRMCMGKRIAEMEIFIFLTKILKTFKINYVRDEKVKPVQKLLLIPNKPIHLLLSDRTY